MKNRVRNLQELLKKKKIDALFISSHENILYLTNYAGFSETEREAYILITRKNRYLITDSRYSEQTKIQIPHITTLERSIDISLDIIIKDIVGKEKIAKVGFEENNIIVLEYKKIKKLFKQCIPIDLSQIREIKTCDEISLIQQACQLADEAFSLVLKEIKAETSEKQLAKFIEDFFRQRGAEPSFPALVAFGENTAIPHHRTSHTILGHNQFVLLDFGAKINNYCSDMTRTLYVGKPSKVETRMYQTVLSAQQEAINFINLLLQKNQQIKASDVDIISRAFIQQSGYPSIPHSLGHGIGIAVHESPTLSPRSNNILKEGMVFSIEPGIYVPKKYGVRIEDIFVMSNGLLKQLTNTKKGLIIC